MLFGLFPDDEFDAAFFLTSLSFVDNASLLGLLIARFRIESPPNLTITEIEFFEDKKLRPLQRRVVSAIIQWIHADTELFQNDESLRKTLLDFVTKDVKQHLPSAVPHIESALAPPARDPKSSTLKREKDDRIPAPILPKSLRSLTVMSLDPLEIARHVSKPFFLSSLG